MTSPHTKQLIRSPCMEPLSMGEPLLSLGRSCLDFWPFARCDSPARSFQSGCRPSSDCLPPRTAQSTGVLVRFQTEVSPVVDRVRTACGRPPGQSMRAWPRSAARFLSPGVFANRGAGCPAVTLVQLLGHRPVPVCNRPFQAFPLPGLRPRSDRSLRSPESARSVNRARAFLSRLCCF